MFVDFLYTWQYDNISCKADQRRNRVISKLSVKMTVSVAQWRRSIVVLRAFRKPLHLVSDVIISIWLDGSVYMSGSGGFQCFWEGGRLGMDLWQLAPWRWINAIIHHHFWYHNMFQGPLVPYMRRWCSMMSFYGMEWLVWDFLWRSAAAKILCCNRNLTWLRC